jgi:hypothetical protein
MPLGESILKCIDGPRYFKGGRSNYLGSVQKEGRKIVKELVFKPDDFCELDLHLKNCKKQSIV